MAIPVAKFEVVEASEAPKVNKVMSEEETKNRQEWANSLKSLQVGKSLKVPLSSVGGEHPSRSFGISLGHIIKDFNMSDQFTTSNDGEFYYITRKPKAETKAAENGAKTPVAASA